MTPNTKLPIYKLKIKEDDDSPSAVEYVALVDQPAIELNWMAFNKQMRFSADPERRLIMGVLMVADMPIYRRDEKMGEFYVVFEKEEIYKIVQKFFRNGFTSNFNIMHDPNMKTDGVYMIESFIVDPTRGVSAPKQFEGVSEGSWIATVKVDNDEIWNDYVKTGILKGFSVEGIFASEYLTSEETDTLEEVARIVKGE